MQTRDRELARAQQQLRSSEALVADLEKNHQERDSQLVQETKVTLYMCMHHHITNCQAPNREAS